LIIGESYSENGGKVFLKRQRLNSPALRGFIAQRPVE